MVNLVKDRYSRQGYLLHPLFLSAEHERSCGHKISARDH